MYLFLLQGNRKQSLLLKCIQDKRILSKQLSHTKLTHSRLFRTIVMRDKKFKLCCNTCLDIVFRMRIINSDNKYEKIQY